jgi:hypothetical protein
MAEVALTGHEADTRNPCDRPAPITSEAEAAAVVVVVVAEVANAMAGRAAADSPDARVKRRCRA